MFLFYSCKNKEYYYPSIDKFNDIKYDTLDINKTSNYAELINKLERLNYKGYYGLIIINSGQYKYNLVVNTRHGKEMTDKVKRKNLITISEDSVLKNDKLYHISMFKKILERDLKNNGSNNVYADNSEKLIISFALSNKGNYKNLIKHLTYIINVYNKLNEDKKYNLNIQLDREFYYYRDLFKNLPK